MSNSTTSQDVIATLNVELERLDAGDLTANPVIDDFTLISFEDNQETEEVTIDQAIAIVASFKALEDNAGFEAAWHAIVEIVGG